MIGALLEHIRPVLAEQDEWDLAETLWTDLRSRGTGAAEQRRWARNGLAEVVFQATNATLMRPGTRIIPS